MARTKSRRVLRSAFGNERFASTARDHLPTRASRTECFVGEHCSVDLSGDGPDRCPLVFVTPPTQHALRSYFYTWIENDNNRRRPSVGHLSPAPWREHGRRE